MEKYYRPTIEEFHPGFEYEAKATFQDGTVKSIDDFNNKKWEKETADVMLMYVQRALTGHNSKGVGCGIRVKYLDREDIESLGWNTTSSETNYRHFINRTKSEYDTPQVVLECIDLHAHIYDIFNLINEGGNRFIVFRGQIKNKSELKVLMKQLNLIK